MIGATLEIRAPATALLLAVSLNAAAATAWQPGDGDSRVGFVATQQGAQFRGSFEAFDVDLVLDPENPASGSIDAVVRTASVDTDNSERDGYLRGSDWFDVERWPTARYESDTIRATDDGYVAEGRLTLRDETRPAEFVFDFEPEASGEARLSGRIDIRRLEYGVGRGIWTDTDWVGDEVRIEVDLFMEERELQQQGPAASIAPEHD